MAIWPAGAHAILAQHIWNNKQSLHAQKTMICVESLVKTAFMGLQRVGKGFHV
jgi:hypothetical protein